ncbi:MAG TPA: hypothetical protein VIK99_09465 [Thermaerobacter sp.]
MAPIFVASRLAERPATMRLSRISRPSSINASASYSRATAAARWLLPVPLGPTRA